MCGYCEQGLTWLCETMEYFDVIKVMWAKRWIRHLWVLMIKQTSSLTSSCVTAKFSVVSEINHMWLLDHQCHGKCVTKFYWIAIYGHWIVNVTRHVSQSFPELPYMIVGSSVLQKHNLLSSVDAIIRDKVWVPKEIEKHCLDNAENCIGNEEKEKHQKREKSDARTYSNYSTTNYQYVRVIKIL